MLPSFDEAYEAIAAAMVDAAKQQCVDIAMGIATRCGLIEIGDGEPSQLTVWERKEGGETLRFEWRWYDQSKPFSLQPDMNILTLSLLQDGKATRSVEHRYED